MRAQRSAPAAHAPQRVEIGFLGGDLPDDERFEPCGRRERRPSVRRTPRRVGFVDLPVCIYIRACAFDADGAFSRQRHAGDRHFAFVERRRRRGTLAQARAALGPAAASYQRLQSGDADLVPVGDQLHRLVGVFVSLLERGE
ncbi:MAG TPA: hypothetical protein VG986_12890, partial [Pseudolabrys sp.]|nr:hypothetical protein [Pseudolabrys sp.]